MAHASMLDLGRFRNRHADEAEAFEEVLESDPDELGADRADVGKAFAFRVS